MDSSGCTSQLRNLRTFYHLLQPPNYPTQRFGIFFCGGPAGAEADDAMGRISGAAVAEAHGFGQFLHLAIFYSKENLIGGGVEVKGQAFFSECLLDGFGILVRRLSDCKIEVIFEKFIKLDAQHPPFG